MLCRGRSSLRCLPMVPPSRHHHCLRLLHHMAALLASDLDGSQTALTVPEAACSPRWQPLTAQPVALPWEPLQTNPLHKTTQLPKLHRQCQGVSCDPAAEDASHVVSPLCQASVVSSASCSSQVQSRCGLWHPHQSCPQPLPWQPRLCYLLRRFYPLSRQCLRNSHRAPLQQTWSLSQTSPRVPLAGRAPPWAMQVLCPSWRPPQYLSHSLDPAGWLTIPLLASSLSPSPALQPQLLMTRTVTMRCRSPKSRVHVARVALATQWCLLPPRAALYCPSSSLISSHIPLPSCIITSLPPDLPIHPFCAAQVPWPVQAPWPCPLLPSSQRPSPAPSCRFPCRPPSIWPLSIWPPVGLGLLARKTWLTLCRPCPPTFHRIFADPGGAELQDHFDGLVQGCSNSSALAMELLQSCTKPSICISMVWWKRDIVYPMKYVLSFIVLYFYPAALKAPGYWGQTSPVNTLTSIIFHGSFSNLARTFIVLRSRTSSIMEVLPH